jgi:hypothetical protein
VAVVDETLCTQALSSTTGFLVLVFTWSIDVVTGPIQALDTDA